MQSTEANFAPISVTRQKRRWRDHPTARFLCVVAVRLGFYVVYGYLTGSRRITSHLHACLAKHPAIVYIRIIAKLPPEELHIRIYQQVGSLRGVIGNTTTLHRVTPAHIRFLSRYYWIQQIVLMGEIAQETCVPQT